MIGMVVKTPNAASPGYRGSSCVAVVRGGSCPNGARWALRSDDGRDLAVCLTHANKAHRRGELLVRR